MKMLLTLPLLLLLGGAAAQQCAIDGTIQGFIVDDEANESDFDANSYYAGMTTITECDSVQLAYNGTSCGASGKCATVVLDDQQPCPDTGNIFGVALKGIFDDQGVLLDSSFVGISCTILEIENTKSCSDDVLPSEITSDAYIDASTLPGGVSNVFGNKLCPLPGGGGGKDSRSDYDAFCVFGGGSPQGPPNDGWEVTKVSVSVCFSGAASAENYASNESGMMVDGFIRAQETGVDGENSFKGCFETCDPQEAASAPPSAAESAPPSVAESASPTLAGSSAPSVVGSSAPSVVGSAPPTPDSGEFGPCPPEDIQCPPGSKPDRSGLICCPVGCNSCGGCECAEEDLGPENCCTGHIRFADIPCGEEFDGPCVLDVECPFDPTLPFPGGLGTSCV